MPQQQWDAAQVNAGFEQMGRAAMTKEMRINDLGELGGVARLAADMRHTRAGDRFGNAGPGKEPGLELVQLPGAPQQWEQSGREHHEAIPLAFALAHPDDHAVGGDVRPLELAEFGDPHARRREGGQDRARLEVAWGQQQRLDLVAREDDRERLGFFGIGNILRHPGTAQGGLVEQAEGTHGLDKDTLGDVLLEEMKLIGADVLHVEAIRRGVEMLGELGDVAEIAIDGMGLVVADLHVFEHALA